jgi:hypothetical protein
MRDALAAPETASLDDVPSVLAAHADTKPVRLLLMPVIRLIRSLHLSGPIHRNSSAEVYLQSLDPIASGPRDGRFADTLQRNRS